MVVHECIVVPLLARFEGLVDEEIERRRREVRERALRFMLNGGAVVLAQVWEVISSFVPDEGQGENGDIVGEDGAANESGLDPQHSVRASLHSIQSSFSQDSTDAVGGTSDMDIDSANDQERFVRDFLAMLSRGLYVFAHISSLGADEGDTNGEGATNKTFSLRVFSFNGDSNAFELSTVDHHHNDPSTSTILPILEIGNVEASGGQAITIALAEGCDGPREVEIVLSDEDDRDILLGGLEACIDHVVGEDESSKE